MYANLYSNLQDIWENKFISTVQPDEIGNWEAELFPNPVDSSLPFEVRKQNLLTKYRATGGLSYPYFMGVVGNILTPLGLDFTINVYCGMPTGAWILDVSALDFDTYLSLTNPIFGAKVGFYDLDCNAQIIASGSTVATSFIVSSIPAAIVSKIQIGAGVTGPAIAPGSVVVSKGTTTITLNLGAISVSTGAQIIIQNYLAAGLTQQEFEDIQEVAYTFAIVIYGNADAQTIATLEQILPPLVPGGTTFVIFNNQSLPIDPNILDLGGGEDCVLVDAYDCGNQTFSATYNVWDFSL
jgi:hypothetical protein